MNHDLHQLLAAWRRAERESDPEAADRAFAALAARWPKVAAPRRLVRGVLTRLPDSGVVPDWRWHGWWVRSAVAVSLLLAGLALGAQTPGTLGETASWVVRATVSACGALFLAAGAWLQMVAAVGRSVGRIGLAVGPSLVDPGPALVCAVSLALSAAALVVLRRVLAVQEV